MLSDRVSPGREVFLIYPSLGKAGSLAGEGAAVPPGRMGMLLRAAVLLSSLLHCSGESGLGMAPALLCLRVLGRGGSVLGRA